MSAPIPYIIECTPGGGCGQSQCPGRVCCVCAPRSADRPVMCRCSWLLSGAFWQSGGTGSVPQPPERAAPATLLGPVSNYGSRGGETHATSAQAHSRRRSRSMATGRGRQQSVASRSRTTSGAPAFPRSTTAGASSSTRVCRIAISGGRSLPVPRKWGIVMLTKTLNFGGGLSYAHTLGSAMRLHAHRALRQAQGSSVYAH